MPLTPLSLHGTGDMTFMFYGPHDSIFGPQWFGDAGVALWTITTPEPGTWLLVPTGVGLTWLARKRRRPSRIRP